MEHSQLLRVKSLNAKDYGGRIIAVATSHNLREIQSEKGADSHIDPTRTHLNIILRGADSSVQVAAEAINLMALAKLKVTRKNGVLGIEIIISLPPSSGIDEQQFFIDVVKWAEGFFEIPILSAVIHSDEAAPHIHIIMLPLFNGRMLGSVLIGGKPRLQAMHDDFHTKVGKLYSLKRGKPEKRYSKAERVLAAVQVVAALRRAPKALDDPAIRDALRDAITETMPACLMSLLGVELPEVKQPKFKPENPIGNYRKYPIGNIAVPDVQKEHSLCSVGNLDSAQDIQPSNTPQSSNQDEVIRELEIVQSDCNQVTSEYTREPEEDQFAGYWDTDTGELIKPVTKAKPKHPKVETMKAAIARNRLPAKRRA